MDYLKLIIAVTIGMFFALAIYSGVVVSIEKWGTKQHIPSQYNSSLKKWT